MTVELPAGVLDSADRVDEAGHADPPVAEEVTEDRGPSLSPSRAADFKTCPLLYRFRVIDRIPEQPTADQLRGTLVHAVLERLFDLPAAERTRESAEASLEPQWRRLVEEAPEIADLFATPEATGEWLGSARGLLEGYFTLEDPRRLEPAERESMVEATVGDGLRLRGIIDRLDVSPAGDIRVVDYKSGGAPREAFEARALFQLKFYALVLWRTRGVVPKVLRLLYLSDREACDYAPDLEELRRFERTLVALWQAIERATERKEFRPKPSRLCDWCRHQALCPEFGGTPPPFPELPVPGEPVAADPPQGGAEDRPR
jgi:putative RecB family exonuclease